MIEPQPEPEPEVIYLRHVECARPQTLRREEDERTYQAPVFILPLKGLSSMLIFLIFMFNVISKLSY